MLTDRETYALLSVIAYMNRLSIDISFDNILVEMTRRGMKVEEESYKSLIKAFVLGYHTCEVELVAACKGERLPISEQSPIRDLPSH